MSLYQRNEQVIPKSSSVCQASVGTGMMEKAVEELEHAKQRLVNRIQ